MIIGIIILVSFLSFVAGWSLNTKTKIVQPEQQKLPYELYAELVEKADQHWDDDPNRAMALVDAAEKMLERASIDAPQLLPPHEWPTQKKR